LLVCTNGEPEEKRLLGRPGRGWEDIIKIYLSETEGEVKE
jgi:hypothetical protein